MNIKITKSQLEEVRNHLSPLLKKALVGKPIKPVTKFQQGLVPIGEEIEINESPDSVMNVNDDLLAHWSNDDSITFGFLNGKSFIGYNNDLFFGSDKIDQNKKYVVDHMSWKNVEKMQMHRGISNFYNILYGENAIGPDRSSFEYPGRLWFDKKIISFWKYPDKNKLPSLLKELSSEIEHIYGLKIDFSNYRIKIKTSEYQADLDADDEDYQPDYEWETNKKIGNLIPIKDFMGSNDASEKEMQNIHTLSSAEKRNTPQMKAARDADNEMLANKFNGDVSQAEWNSARNKYRGESKTIIITKDQLNEINKHLEEDIKLPVKVGDTILMGKFKNKKVVIKSIGEDDFGMPTINGKKAATFRIPKKIEENVNNIDPYKFFKNNKTGMGFYDDIIKGDGEEGVGYEIILMTPDAYFKNYLRSKNSSGYGVENYLKNGGVQQNKIDIIMKGMDSGIKYDLPMIDFRDGFQEGRHRVLSAKELGVGEIPVVIFFNINNKPVILTEAKDYVYGSYDGRTIEAGNEDYDSIPFVYTNNKVWVGYNPSLGGIYSEDGYVDDNGENDYPNFHGDIADFYRFVYRNTPNYKIDLPIKRDSYEYLGRIWYDSKVVSFYKYPEDKNKMKYIMKLLNKELDIIYGETFYFDDFLVDTNDNGLVPMNQYVGSSNSSNQEMESPHLLPADQKINNQQFKSSLDAKYDYIGNKLGNVTQAEYNHYKRYGMGESITDESKLIEKEISIKDILPNNSDGQTLLDAINNVKDGLTSKTEGNILVHEKNGRYEIADGFHRVAQAILDGKNTIVADVLPTNLTEATIDDVNLNSFKPKKELNTKFWDESGKLKPIVRKRLLKIADDFIEYLTIDIKKVNDIIFLGSMANYNWSSYSDVDLHLIVDFSKINKDTQLVEEYFDSKKKLWNDEHESLKIFGFPVELYVQDVKQENVSVGQFSLEKNKWLSKPEIINDSDFNKKKIKEKASAIMTQIEDLLKDYKSKPTFAELNIISNKTKKLYDKIKKIRKQGLESEDGETSVGNIVFKVLRRNGYFEKLMDLKIVTYDKINSIK